MPGIVKCYVKRVKVCIPAKRMDTILGRAVRESLSVEITLSQKPGIEKVAHVDTCRNRIPNQCKGPTAETSLRIWGSSKMERVQFCVSDAYLTLQWEQTVGSCVSMRFECGRRSGLRMDIWRLSA